MTAALTTCARRRHGRSLEWCSMAVERTTWRGSRGYRKASLLIASVVFFPKMTVAVRRVGADKARDRRMGLVVCGGAEARLEASSPVNA